MAIQLEKYVSGHSQPGAGYKYFLPSRINDQWQWSDSQLNTLLEKASIRLGELNAYAHIVPNIDLFIELHVTKEAVVSSRIEGTQTNIREAILPQEEILPERRNDWKEVNNYTQALNDAIKSLEGLPLSSRLLRQSHQQLMDGVRGQHKLPGEYRSSQNWIGGTSPSDAVFVPPAHIHLDDLMGDLENFLHNDKINVPALIRIGIAHYQFETIHPFLDGNGRIGRLLITLFLIDKAIMSRPLLYLSAWFEKDKSVYYDNLTRVRKTGDMMHWLKYFLKGVEQTAAQAVATLTEVVLLKQKLECMIHAEWGRRTQSAILLLNHLFRHPVVNIKDVQEVCSLSKKSAGDLIDTFEKAKIVEETTGQSRNRFFMFSQYTELFHA
jgi:Fic family protein